MKELECDVCEERCEHPQVICLAKAELVSDEMAQQVAETFKILGDPTRVKILQTLSQRELCVCDLAAVLNMGQSAVSHQLRVLRSARLVKYRREGKMAWYCLDDGHISNLLAQGLSHVGHE
ncbi:Transcriptional repressor SmtB [bioreactor metagenome]|uniref:Transcriptional repressor SmtB n=1 Tax=bioreactor metagenome TaxID=1076179 RepID=A0A644TP90_9ZZZZ|nr:metalloregulator ArsR/SmtB family transcription factor [Negativicutes bacterium]